MPMSASCVVNRAELLAMLEEVRAALPDSLAQAQELIGGREQMVERGPPGGRADHRVRARRARLADLRHRGRPAVPGRGRPDPRRGPPGGRGDPRRGRRLRRQQARQLRGRPHQDHRLRRPRPREAARPRPRPRRAGLRGRGRRGPGAQRRPGDAAPRADEYVDAKLGAFEAVLAKTLEAVGRGRQKLHGRIAIDDLGAHMAAAGRDARSPARPATPTTWPAWPSLGADRARPPQAPRCPGSRPARRRSPGDGSPPQPQLRAAAATQQQRRLPAAGRVRLPAAAAGPVRPAAGPVRLRLAAGQQQGYDPSGYASSRPQQQPSSSRSRPAPQQAAAPRRDQPLRHQHDRPGPAAAVRAGALSRPGRGPGRTGRGLGCGGASSILALRSRVSSAISAARTPSYGRRRDAHRKTVESRKALNARLDHRNPLVFDTHELGRRPGAMQQALPLGRRPPRTSASRGHRSAGRRPVELDLRLESVMEGVLVTGTARAPAEGECVRCLEPLERELDADFQEMFSYPDADDRGRAQGRSRRRRRGRRGHALPRGRPVRPRTRAA